MTGDIFEPTIKPVDRKTQTITVGRDTPPQIVENSIAPEKLLSLEQKELEQEQQNKPDKSDG